MTTVYLVRHGRTAANATGVLAGWTPGIALDDLGQAQARHAARRLANIPFTHIVSSPLERTVETADALAEGREITRDVDDRLGECRYGDWTGEKLSTLAKDPLWRVVQEHPSAAVFPGPEGESMGAMAHRAVSAIRSWNSKVGSTGVYAAVSHGDVIKAILADALGMHLDSFQRLCVDPCSISVIEYSERRPFVRLVNDTGAETLPWAPPVRRRGRRASDAVVGGGKG